MGKENIRFFAAWIILGKVFATFSSDPEHTTVNAYVNSTATPPALPTTTEWIRDYAGIVSKFSLRTADIPDDDMCYLVAGRPESIQECEFNPGMQTFVIIHGWTVTGMFESWVPKLVSALYEREPGANVIVVDWLTRANQHYTTSAAYTKLVGRDVAKFVTWIQKELHLSWEKIHLLGYSLGAHVAGIAGDLTDHKISRITGLDPAGPTFEHAEDQDTLSRDDAQFVDVLHTNTRGSPGRSIGIQKAVGHIDIYPNGGTFQPGCNIQNTLMGIALEGIKGLQMFHYQVKMHLFSKDSLSFTEQPIKVSLYGTHGEKEDIPHVLPVMNANTTLSFLITTDMDMGDLMMVKLRWEKDAIISWSDWWGSSRFHVRKLRIKSGETQSKIIFSAKEAEFADLLRGGEAAVFVKSKEDNMSRKEKLMHKMKTQGSLFAHNA
ncbi:lipoprotein lipase-like isoform X3 [Dunckerocampus dactyliophorus]|uniref:lipoprotein lipase-like isoform X3 n=1 Tax=Dunckerocampus dactyliophorus TaxID=161453 RepID=UPI002406F54C|nr:lipoprotein lipase-like isoform X3 [Dunckerocampus dactyliophorus]